MTNKARFRVGGNGSATLPITGGTDEFTTKPLEEGYERIYFSVVFYTDSALSAKATPTTGTVTFKGFDEDSEVAIDSGSFNAADVYSTEILQPAATGNFSSVSVTFDGVDSGLYARAWVVQKGADQ